MKLILLFCFSPFFLFSQCNKIDFIYKFGVSDATTKNELRTAENIFIKDMVVDSPLVFKLRLTQKEKKLILNKLKEIDFWSYPEKFYYEAAPNKDSLISSSSLCENYSMTVNYCGKEKQVRWNDCGWDKPSVGLKHEKLEALGNSIWNIIYSKKVYKKSKQPRAMYL